MSCFFGIWLKPCRVRLMTLMIVLLLIMNVFLAVGFIMLWFRSQICHAKFLELEAGLMERLHQLEAKLSCKSKTQEQEASSAYEWMQKRIDNQKQAGSMRSALPERYKLAVTMADNGFDLQQLYNALGISNYEADQLASLAKLAQRSAEKIQS